MRYSSFRRHSAGFDGRDRVEVFVSVLATDTGRDRTCNLEVNRRGERFASVWTANRDAMTLARQTNNAYAYALARDARVGECPLGVLADWIEERADLFYPGPYQTRPVAELVADVARWLRAAEAWLSVEVVKV